MDLGTFGRKVQKKFKLNPVRMKLGRARNATLKIIHEDEKAQYSMPSDYGQELRRSNPWRKFIVCTTKVKKKDDLLPKDHLSSLYWSYYACKRGFLSECMPIIFVDECHLKSKYKYVLLTAVGIDPNDCIFPIAIGDGVEVESTFSWQIFLTTLKNDLNIINTSPFTIMSDKQKGLINVVEKIWPDTEHIFCIRHLYQNFHKKFTGETLKNILWAIASSNFLDKWNLNREKLREHNLEAYNWLDGKPPNQRVKLSPEISLNVTSC
ncbi:protein FAR-RED IMPAIRED RESPONSE 1-like [Aegilops tauschii subsp. strangulata]|uniref:protein FAR-RED IMPAIRED RESPONSE 1-like n=1 Tax=Aegilops tauschii subsp. strangulata TaxID=200361 RepID=UPI003CC8DD25